LFSFVLIDAAGNSVPSYYDIQMQSSFIASLGSVFSPPKITIDVGDVLTFYQNVLAEVHGIRYNTSGVQICNQAALSSPSGCSITFNRLGNFTLVDTPGSGYSMSIEVRAVPPPTPTPYASHVCAAAC
jgi:plastocyanin